MGSTIFHPTPRVFAARARFRRVAASLGTAVLIGSASLVGGAALTSAAPLPVVAAPQVTGDSCAGDEGVTVVVDFTDLGGDVVLGCAPGTPASGRAALESAGFSLVDSMPGMVCTINSMPDPCPEEFDGNFWSYWFAGDDGEWEMSMVGLDEAEPAPGSVEGWRYFDGSQPPSISLDALNAGGGGSEPGGSEPGDSATNSPDSSSGLPGWAFPVIAVGVLGALVAVIARRKNQ